MLIPAAGAWLGAAAGLAWIDAAESVRVVYARSGSLLAGALAVAVVLPVSALALRFAGAGAGRGALVVLIAAMLGCGGVAAAASHVHGAVGDPVAGWIDERVTARVAGTVSAEGRLRTGGRGWGGNPRSWIDVPMRVDRVLARGQIVDRSMTILLRLVSDQDVPSPGSAIEVTGRLARVPVSSGAAARLDAGADPALVVRSDPQVVERLARAMRVGLRTALSRSAAEPASLVAGLAIGDESQSPEELTTAMRATGLAHLTAVSGGNVAILLGLVLGVATALRLPLWARVVGGLAALAFFVVLVGPEPSVLRAATMGAVAVTALLVGGRRAGPSVLSAAVLGLVLVAPWLALTWGFALSVFATAGLILLAPLIADGLSSWWATARWPPALRLATALTTAAQLATLPLLVAMGGTAGWVAVPANLLAMPVVPAVTILGLSAAAVSPVFPAVAAALAVVAGWPAGWIATVAHAAQGLPLAQMPWPSGWTGVATVAGVLGLLVPIVIVVRKLPSGGLARLLLAAGAVSLVILLAALPPGRRGWPPEGWIVLMCDVGQGDALLIRSGPHRAVMFDVGPEPARARACLDDAEIDSISMLVLTHFHIDHVGGLSGVVGSRSIGTAIVTPIREPLDEAAGAVALLESVGVEPVDARAGDSWTIGEVTLTILAPRRRIDAGSVPNNASLVAVVESGDRRILLTGDVETEAQVAIAPDLGGGSFDVVKIPHHGSARSAPELPSWARAAVALVSVGADNPYGHPDEPTLRSWRAAGAHVARTDELGDVAVVETGSGMGLVGRRGRTNG